MALSKYTSNSVLKFDIGKSEYDRYVEEYFAMYGAQTKTSNNNKTIRNSEQSMVDGWNTAYGRIEIKPAKNKKYCWAFFIEQHHQKYSSVAIGIHEEIVKENNYTNTYFQGQPTKHYGYKSNGKKYSHLLPKGVAFSDAFDSNGNIVMMLLDGFRLSFCKLSMEFCKQFKVKTMEDYIENGAWIVAEEKIERNTKYKIAVSLYGKTKLFSSTKLDESCVELMGFKLIDHSKNDDNKQESDDSEDDDEDDYKQQYDNDLKNAIISLEQQMEKFQLKYNNQQIAAAFNKDSKSVDVIRDINKLKLRINSFISHIDNIEDYISSIINPDINQYQQWDIPQMIQWISTLENGKYKKYAKAFRKGFKSDNITSGEILPDLSTHDLSTIFNIRDFTDRKRLVAHFQSLGQPGVQTYV